MVATKPAVRRPRTRGPETTTDPRVDAYIAKAAEFARPILRHLREVVHDASPEITETIKWGAPHFEYRGTLCGIAAFKFHCAFWFWKGALVVDDQDSRAGTAMGQFGRITKVEDLPSRKTLIGYVRKAMELKDESVGKPRSAPARPKRKELAIPDYFQAALKKNPNALATFESFSPSHRREYIEWITEAKGEDTRQRRMATALEWLAEGKPRNWKYVKKS